MTLSAKHSNLPVIQNLFHQTQLQTCKLYRHEKRYKICPIEWFGQLKVTQTYCKQHHSIKHIRVHVSLPQLLCLYLAPFLRCSKILIENRRLLPTLPVFGAPVKVIRLECRREFWHQKTRLSYASYSFSYFRTLIPACDRQTDGHATTAYTALAQRHAVNNKQKFQSSVLKARTHGD